MSSKLDEKYFDVRVTQRYQKKSVISKSDIEDFKKSLPDDKDNFELTTISLDDVGPDMQALGSNITADAFLEKKKFQR